tara:strand:+ start:224 stop:343 length:120 start_codon:yes stop_codon:yes gene_type:complete
LWKQREEKRENFLSVCATLFIKNHVKREEEEENLMHEFF